MESLNKTPPNQRFILGSGYIYIKGGDRAENKNKSQPTLTGANQIPAGKDRRLGSSSTTRPTENRRNRRDLPRSPDSANRREDRHRSSSGYRGYGASRSQPVNPGYNRSERIKYDGGFRRPRESNRHRELNEIRNDRRREEETGRQKDIRERSPAAPSTTGSPPEPGDQAIAPEETQKSN